jgi:hypothetical protein
LCGSCRLPPGRPCATKKLGGMLVLPWAGLGAVVRNAENPAKARVPACRLSPPGQLSGYGLQPAAQLSRRDGSAARPGQRRSHPRERPPQWRVLADHRDGAGRRLPDAGVTGWGRAAVAAVAGGAAGRAGFGTTLPGCWRAAMAERRAGEVHRDGVRRRGRAVSGRRAGTLTWAGVRAWPDGAGRLDLHDHRGRAPRGHDTARCSAPTTPPRSPPGCSREYRPVPAHHPRPS